MGSADTACRYVQCARDGILRRTNTVFSLWKRRDEFRKISAKVAAGVGELEELEKTRPALNELDLDKIGELEEKLNEGLGNSIALLVCKTKLDPFKSSDFDRLIGKYKIIDQAGGITLLTKESAIVKALKGIVDNEPALGVTILGEESEVTKRWAELQDRFVSIAKQILIESGH